MLRITLTGNDGTGARLVNIPTEPFTETKGGRRRITATTNANEICLPSPCKVQVGAANGGGLPEFSMTYEAPASSSAPSSAPTSTSPSQQAAWVQLNQPTDPYVIQL